MLSAARFLVFMALLAAPAFAHPHHARQPMAEAAKQFIASLTPEQREKTLFRFDDEERFFWHYIPSDDIPDRYQRPRKGLMLSEMTPAQKHLAAALLSAGLSQQGYIKTTAIMSLEDVLRIIENDTRGRRDPEKYHFSIFGEPTDAGTWGYRVEGHHVSLHYTVVKGRAVGNPTFLGSNPAEVRTGPRAGLRVLAAEEDHARALLAALTPGQLKVAVVSPKAPDDILTTTSRQAALQGQPAGLKAAAMNTEQRKLLEALIDEYIGNLPAGLAGQRRERLKAAGRELWFAWAGPVEKGAPHYYRVQAPTFLIEYDNTQNGANHVHTVWRDFNGDWGVDLLKEHYAASPPGHGHTGAGGARR